LAGRQGHTSGQLLYSNAEFSINAEAKDRDSGIAGMRVILTWLRVFDYLQGLVQMEESGASVDDQHMISLYELARIHRDTFNTSTPQTFPPSMFI